MRNSGRGWATTSIMGAVTLLLLTGCSTAAVHDDLPAPSTPPTLSAAARRAIAAAQEQAEQADSPTAPATVLPDTIETWPAVDHGARPHADGPVTETSDGVFRYTVVADDGYAAIAERFGLCAVDVTAGTSGGELQPGETLVLQRHDDDPDAHAAAVCDPQG